LKIAKGYPEAVSQRWKDNAMTKRKRTNNDITQKTKEPYIKPGVNSSDPQGYAVPV